MLGSLLALCLAACAVGPEYETPDLALPGHWGAAPRAQVERTHAEAAPDLKAWWRRMGDPVLDALMDEAVAGNLDVATAKANVRAARASYRQQVGGLFPQVTGNASGTRGDTGGRVGSDGDVTVDSGYGQYQAGLDASWEIDLFGANRRGVEAAAFGVDASVDDLDAVLLTLVGDVASNYADARGYQAQIALARRTASSSLHSVNEITRGSRWGAFFWSQSMIKEGERRALLYDLDLAIIAIRTKLQDDDPEVLALTNVYHNLLRQWAEM